MVICLRLVEMILCDGFFFTDFIVMSCKEKWYKENIIH